MGFRVQGLMAFRGLGNLRVQCVLRFRASSGLGFMLAFKGRVLTVF